MPATVLPSDNRCFVKELLRKEPILVLLGTGGVGKTTVAAALGLAGALEGLNSAVITVDPSQRLRDVLKLRKAGEHPVRIEPRRLRRVGVSPGIRLAAVLLDVKGQWDSMVERLVPDPARRQRILNNRFYRSLAGEFAGADAYAALEQLYDLRESGQFDLTVLDTPPASQALEFLEAPTRLVRLLDSGAVRWLFSSKVPGQQLAMRAMSRMARSVTGELERFAGGDVLSSISDFFTSAAAATSALADRFRKADALLHSSSVQFAIVTTAEPDRLQQARDLVADMQRQRLRPVAVIINRFLDEQGWSELAHHRRPAGGAALRAALGRDLDADSGLKSLVGYILAYSRRRRNDIERIKQFARQLPLGVRLAAAPELFLDTANLRTLKQIAGYLTVSDAPIERATRGAEQGAGTAERRPETRKPE